MADAHDVLRQDALTKRINGSAGGLSIAWSAKDKARIHDHVMSTPLNMLVRELPMASRELVDAEASSARRRFSECGVVIRAATKPEDLAFLFVISSEITDLAGDVVSVEGIDRTDFLRNPVVLNSHDSSALPIATSTAPLVSGKTMTAIAKFPKPGVSNCSDQVAAAIRGGLVRGSSIGFVPLKWAFTKDPSRPFGVDFKEIKLLEWSTCSVPCNPACLLLGTVDGKSSSRSSSRNRQFESDAMAGRRSEARALAAKARSTIASITDDPASTREQRLVEARNFRAMLGSGR
jgi:phage head maturation protease